MMYTIYAIVLYKQCTIHIFVAHLFSSLANKNVHAIHPIFLQPQNDPLNHPHVLHEKTIHAKNWQEHNQFCLNK